jgi:hypothetical protein
MSEDNYAKSPAATDASSVVLNCDVKPPNVIRPIAGRIVAAGHDDALIELEGGDFAIGETVVVHAESRAGAGGNMTTGIVIAARRVQLDHYYGGIGKRVWARRPPRS